MGCVSNKKVLILINGGSTHNFIQEHLVATLGLRAQPTQPLRVMVGNGDEIDCLEVCGDVLVQVQGHKFIVYFHVLPFCGADLVLGVQWLKSLGPVLMDYIDLTMKFMHHVESNGLRIIKKGGLN